MKVRLLLLTAIAVLTSLAAATSGPQQALAADAQWTVSYWNNTNLSGTPVVTQMESDINYNWGTGSPVASVSADQFSARWTRTVYFSAGTYRFTTTSDDGIRVWVDNRLILNEWYNHSTLVHTADITLGAGDHSIRVEYFENVGLAEVRVSWAASSGSTSSYPTTAWRGEYFNNMTLSGTPAVLRDDPNIEFKWLQNSPMTGIIADQFSVRWTRSLLLTPGRYRFTLTVDDGARLWVNNEIIIDAWKDQSASTYSAEIDLAGGPVPVRLEYFDHYVDAYVKLTWFRVTESTTDWRAEYFNNTTLSGTPAVVRDEAGIDYDWGYNAPVSGVGKDSFSVRWTRMLDLPAGTYRFKLTVDDGARLWVNNQLLIDTWKDQQATTYTALVDSAGGAVPVKLEYFEHGYGAVAKLSWAEVQAASLKWHGEFFNNMYLIGKPVLAEDVDAINFDWKYAAPGKDVQVDYFSARWTHSPYFNAGRYRFTLVADDGARLWVNNQLVIDAWKDQAAAVYTAEVDLQAGFTPIRLEYYDKTGEALISLNWAASTTPAPTPTPSPAPGVPSNAVVIDDGDSTFKSGGATNGFSTASAGYGSDLKWSSNDSQAVWPYQWARWYPNLSPGKYEVFVYIPTEKATTRRAMYWVRSASGFQKTIVDQYANRGTWVSLGTYTFYGSADEYVSLSSVTYETADTTQVAFDAVQFARR